jgi:oligopeptide/dipeptide ABC transporter ATP-binding protein
LLNAIPKMDPSKRREEPPMKEEARTILSDQLCLFQPRCPHSREKCQIEEPLLLDEGEDHFVACHFASTMTS